MFILSYLDVVRRYADFVMTKYSHDEVYELLEAAHFYDIPPLLDLTCAYVATLIKGKPHPCNELHMDCILTATSS